MNPIKRLLAAIREWRDSRRRHRNLRIFMERMDRDRRAMVMRPWGNDEVAR